ELAVSGSPDLRKEDSALGLAALFTSSDRTRYAMVRVLADRTPFEDGGARRDRIVWRAQAEARWAQGAFSSWLRADLGTPDAVFHALAPANGGMRAAGWARCSPRKTNGRSRPDMRWCTALSAPAAPSNRGSATRSTAPRSGFPRSASAYAS